MSFDLSVHLATARMPKPQEWQTAIARHGFPLKIETAFDACTLSGWLPCEYQGKVGGFEYACAVLDNEELNELDVPHSFPCMISFSASARVREECMSEVIAAAVLAELAGGLLVDPQEGRRHESADAIRWAKELERTYKSDCATQQDERPIPKPSTSWWKVW